MLISVNGEEEFENNPVPIYVKNKKIEMDGCFLNIVSSVCVCVCVHTHMHKCVREREGHTL